MRVREEEGGFSQSGKLGPFCSVGQPGPPPAERPCLSRTRGEGQPACCPCASSSTVERLGRVKPFTRRETLPVEAMLTRLATAAGRLLIWCAMAKGATWTVR